MHLVNYKAPFIKGILQIRQIRVTLSLMAKNWLFKYKLYHIPFWMLYNYLLWALALNSPTAAAADIFFSVYFVKYLFYVIFPAFAVYFNLYFLIPRYLEKGHYARYLTYLALDIVIASILIAPGYYLSAYLAGSTALKTFGITSNFNGLYQLIKGDPFRSTLAVTTLAMSIKLAKNWLEAQQRHRLLEKEKLETELKFLKYQFNPHFLFNSINSIFFLIHKNPNMASDSLAKFSELLRYQLYECNDAQITLDKELAYLENFIELEKLRQDHLELQLSINKEHAAGFTIAPFILMTFVENAFKHVSKHQQQKNWISIALQVNGKTLDFCISNSCSADETPQVVRYSGIGLKNVQRRLDLLYPGQYQLDIKNLPDIFEVKFQLTLTEPA